MTSNVTSQEVTLTSNYVTGSIVAIFPRFFSDLVIFRELLVK